MRYRWDGLYSDIKNYVKSCEPCQKCSAIRLNEPLHPTTMSALWRKVGLNVIYMPIDERFKYLALIRDDLTWWPEGEPMQKNDSRTMKKFVRKWIFRFGILKRVVCDRWLQNQKEMQEVLDQFGVLAVSIATYHLQSNGLIERGHQQIVDALAKLRKKWVRNLDSVL